MFHLERLHSDHLMKRVLSCKSRSPTNATSTGKVLLAYALNETRERAISLGLRRYTARTLTDPDELRRELAPVRARDYATNREEFRPGTSSVAVPILGKDGTAVAAMAVVAPSHSLSAIPMANALRLRRQARERLARTSGIP